ncbi:HNH endonuclease family protein [Actinoallomurus oryzae]|uniref:HNH endonuclease family protein n=1 Tax=Actinoallomurus oryzae TaxID=502180 RepID=A0ABP8RAL5_9ACTN
MPWHQSPVTARLTAVAAVTSSCLALTACSAGNADSAPADPHGQLAHLRIAAPGSSAGYSRARFGTGWVDTDHNHCDTRNDILARDLTNLRRRGQCTVTAGTLHDRYTGKTLTFRRGSASALVQIDHIYPLHRMWVMGAAQWSLAQREKAANDRRNLLAVDGSANEAKGDQGPAEWMPQREERCGYATRYITVATAYRLPITTADKTALGRMLATC